MTALLPSGELHPADRVHAERAARIVRQIYALIGADGRDSGESVIIPVNRCEHGMPPGECRACIELRHAELGSVTVRAAYAFGEWPAALLLVLVVLLGCQPATPAHGEPGHDHDTMHSAQP